MPNVAGRPTNKEFKIAMRLECIISPASGRYRRALVFLVGHVGIQGRQAFGRFLRLRALLIGGQLRIARKVLIAFIYSSIHVKACNGYVKQFAFVSKLHAFP
jgi:hypothetical protein